MSQRRRHLPRSRSNSQIRRMVGKGPGQRDRTLRRGLRCCIVFTSLLLMAAFVVPPGFQTSDSSQPVFFTYFSCMKLARKFPEPYTSEYWGQKIDLNGPMYAFYRMKEKSITKSQIDAQRNAGVNDCRLAIKVKNRALYVYQGNKCFSIVNGHSDPALRGRYKRQLELILLTLEIYDVPDTDFILGLSDGPIPTGNKGERPPALSYCIVRGEVKRNGFTYPSYGAYENALGKQQLKFFRTCQRLKYPISKRIAKTVWRGSTTGSRSLWSVSDVYKNRRVTLARLGVLASDIMDVGLTDYVQTNKSDPDVMEALKTLVPLKPRIHSEDFAKYAGVIDLDGNAWSDRLPHLLISAAPVLKQEYYKWFEYFGHLLTENEVTFFKEDLTDIVQKTNELLHEYKFDRERWEAKLAAAHAFAEEHLSHLGVVRAMAYAMTKQASLQNWTVELEPDYVEIPRNVCCRLNPSFPKELIDKMQSS